MNRLYLSFFKDQFGEKFMRTMAKPWLKWVVLLFGCLTCCFCGCFGCCFCCWQVVFMLSYSCLFQQLLLWKMCSTCSRRRKFDFNYNFNRFLIDRVLYFRGRSSHWRAFFFGTNCRRSTRRNTNQLIHSVF